MNGETLHVEKVEVVYKRVITAVQGVTLSVAPRQIVAILGNNAQVTAQSVSATLQHVRAGKLRPLATFGATRSKALPDVPTLKELGYDVEYYLWVGIFAPKGVPSSIETILRAAIGKATQSDLFQAALANAGQELAYMDGPDFQRFWDLDGKRTDEAVNMIGRQG